MSLTQAVTLALVGNPTLQQVVGVEDSPAHARVVTNSVSYLGGRSLLEELEGCTVYNGSPPVLREGRIQLAAASKHCKDGHCRSKTAGLDGILEST